MYKVEVGLTWEFCLMIFYAFVKIYFTIHELVIVIWNLQILNYGVVIKDLNFPTF